MVPFDTDPNDGFSPVIFVNDKEQMEDVIAERAIANILKLSPGYDVDCSGLIIVRRYEYPVWVVEWHDYYDKGDPRRDTALQEFDNPEDAARLFVQKRRELDIGLPDWY